MSASERRYERACKALLLVGALIHWTAAALLIGELRPPSVQSSYAKLSTVISAVIAQL